MRFRHILLLLVGICALWTCPAQAQILMVTGEYRVTDIDRGQQRFGIALREDNPNKRQNWVYVFPDTHVIVRHYLGHGTFRDKVVGYNEIWGVLQKGRKLKVSGGRAWDNSIHAKKIWM